MKHSFVKIVPSRLMVVGLGTTLFVLCIAAITMLFPGLIGRERLADRLVDGLQSLGLLESGDVTEQNLDRTLFAIFQSNKASRNISYLRFVDLNDGSIFTFDEKGVRKPFGRAEPDIWADLMNNHRAINIDSGKFEIFRVVSPEQPIAVNLGIEPEVAYEIESQRRLSAIVGSIILATGIGILIMIWQTRQIEEAKGELELVLANTVEPILMVDNYCRLVFANEPARALLGQPKAKKFKNPPLLPLIKNPDNLEFFAKMLSNEQSDLDELETTFPGYPDKVTFRAGVLDVKTEVGRPLGKLLVLRDMTLEKRLEDKKVSQTIHELKGMLGEVKGFIRQALESIDGESQREQRAFLNICLEKLERCYDTVAAMVRSIVSAFKPQSFELRLRHSDLTEILKFNVTDFGSSLEKEKAEGSVLELRLPEKLPTVCCDRNAISRVIVNLLLNATQHCPRGTIVVAAKEKDEIVQVSVSDTGSGIPSENLENIFEPHVSYRKEGSGLGLSICRDFIKAHGGEMWAESGGRGKGSVFHFTLPKSRPVILSSDPTLTGRLESGCRRSGYHPVVLRDFLAATRSVVEINPNAILLDLDMQDTISGTSLAYRLKKTGDTAKIPIIAFASNLSDAQSELSRYEGITLETCLRKDFSEEDLRSAMGTVEAYWYLAQSF
jgi:signal transduction histidine kinase